MAKEFYTERDIEDMIKRGERSIMINDEVVLTDLAYEKAKRLGIDLIQCEEKPPAAPVRPYINDIKVKTSLLPITLSEIRPSKIELIRNDVKLSVRANLNGHVDEMLLDRVIDRVAAELGLN